LKYEAVPRKRVKEKGAFSPLYKKRGVISSKRIRGLVVCGLSRQLTPVTSGRKGAGKDDPKATTSESKKTGTRVPLSRQKKNETPPPLASTLAGTTAKKMRETPGLREHACAEEEKTKGRRKKIKLSQMWVGSATRTIEGGGSLGIIIGLRGLETCRLMPLCGESSGAPASKEEPGGILDRMKSRSPFGHKPLGAKWKKNARGKSL